MSWKGTTASIVDDEDDNAKFLSNLEWSARKILRKSNQKRRECAALTNKKIRTGKNHITSSGKQHDRPPHIQIDYISKDVDVLYAAPKPPPEVQFPCKKSLSTTIFSGSLAEMAKTNNTEFKKGEKNNSFEKSRRYINSPNSLRKYREKQLHEKPDIHESFLQSPFYNKSASHEIKRDEKKNSPYSIVDRNIHCELKPPAQGKLTGRGIYTDSLPAPATTGAKKHSAPTKRSNWHTKDLKEKLRRGIRRFHENEAVLDDNGKSHRPEIATVCSSLIGSSLHPIYKCLKGYIKNEQDRAKQRTQKKIALHKFVTDVHSIWIANDVHSCKLNTQCAQENDIPSASQRSQFQSVSTLTALNFFEEVAATRSNHLVDFSKFHSSSHKQKMNTTKSYKRRDSIISSDLIFLLREVDTFVDGGKYKKAMTVTIVQFHDTRGRFGPKNCIIWCIQAYNTSNGKSFDLLLADEEVETCHALVRTNSPSHHQIKICEEHVYTECTEFVLENFLAKGSCSVFVKQDPCYISAIIKFNLILSRKNDHADCSPFTIELEVSIMEVLLRLNNRCNFSCIDYQFWRRKTNGTIIWSPLIKHMELRNSTPPQGESSCDSSKYGLHCNYFSIGFKTEPFLKARALDFVDKLCFKNSKDMDLASSEWEQSYTRFSTERLLATKKAYELLNHVYLVDLTGGNGCNVDKLTLHSNELKQPCKSIATNQVPMDKLIWGEEENMLSLSMRTAAGPLVSSSSLCPGCANVGQIGIGFVDDSSRRNLTHAVACFVRGQNIALQHHVLVFCAVALDKPIFCRQQVVEDKISIQPMPLQPFKQDGAIPNIVPQCTILIESVVNSDVDIRLPCSIYILSPEDQINDELINATTSRISKNDTSSIASDEKPPCSISTNCLREMAQFTKYSFRTKCWENSMVIDGTFPSKIFGVTVRGLRPNTTDVNRRNLWHSEQRCTEQLSRKRDAHDYVGIIHSKSKNKNGGNQNEGTLFAIQMKTYSMFAVQRTRYSQYKRKREEIQLRKETEIKRSLLQEKIQKGIAMMNTQLETQKKYIIREITDKYIGPKQSESNAADIHRQGVDSTACENIRNPLKKDEEFDMHDANQCNTYDDERTSTQNESEKLQHLNGKHQKYKFLQRTGTPESGHSFNGKISTTDDIHKDKCMSVEEICIDQLEDFFSTKNSKKSHSKDDNSMQNHIKESSVLNNNLENTENETCTNHSHIWEGGCNGINKQPTNQHTGLKGYGWRRLPRAKIGENFFHLKKHKIEKCSGDMFNQCNKSCMIGMVDPARVIDYKVDNSIFQTSKESVFIKNVMEDINQSIKAAKIRENREDFILKASDAEILKHITSSQPNALTNVDNIFSSDIDNKVLGYEDNEDEMDKTTKAILAVKNENLPILEEVLDVQGLNVDTRDEHGNTLFILSCQQGNKKIAKFLLRRGAAINAQNHTGNTVLHYLHAYANTLLADYAIRKGANDSILNVDGLTCYEGLNRDNLDLI